MGYRKRGARFLSMDRVESSETVDVRRERERRRHLICNCHVKSFVEEYGPREKNERTPFLSHYWKTLKKVFIFVSKSNTSFVCFGDKESTHFQLLKKLLKVFANLALNSQAKYVSTVTLHNILSTVCYHFFPI